MAYRGLLVSSVFRRRIYTKTRIHPNVIQSRRLSLEIRPSLDGSRNRQCTIESRVSAFEETSSTSPERDPVLQTLSTRNKGSTMRSVTLQLPPLNTQTKPTTIRRRCTGTCFMSPTIRQNVVRINTSMKTFIPVPYNYSPEGFHFSLQGWTKHHRGWQGMFPFPSKCTSHLHEQWEILMSCNRLL